VVCYVEGVVHVGDATVFDDDLNAIGHLQLNVHLRDSAGMALIAGFRVLGRKSRPVSVEQVLQLSIRSLRAMLVSVEPHKGALQIIAAHYAPHAVF
jgi:hypothetical protein